MEQQEHAVIIYNNTLCMLSGIYAEEPICILSFEVSISFN
jgi:hypothetical protein